ncbi:type IV pili methyl-accepting chemotaxis transducer N-terminal domain-containing protein [Loktanella sp. F6476L]|uniref:type IV pili methyl-accepting chemotaxis transducer N-terminal domain-containing protein n=1 Tax=Loktanella sp. F6476L TaxID=2926405 RepID=UPI001FF4E2B5|nr:type IV pili methyl-accepting chemotaxis transducer N-terminal domain-containing protein [Loktanella sp. F6476L]MCK0118931.1 type IV pili methyl-accepting chemotaxis transducer N-terminal domain-containing protein [Loktanella sp. F6476L]
MLNKLSTGTRALSALSLALLASAAFVPTAHAQSISEDSYSGSKARVNQSAKLRTYSEEVAAATCRVANDLDPEAASEDLTRIRSNVTAILAGLRDGDPALGIPSGETSSSGIKSIAAVNEIWTQIDAAAAKITDNHGDTESLNLVATSFAELSERTSVLASDISGAHSDPLELLQGDAITLNFVGRQTTLLDQMDRIVCGMATGNAAFGTAEDLTASIELFELSLNALRNGYSDAGIAPPPNDAVAQSLEEVHKHWIEEKAILEDIVVNGGTAESVVEVASFTRVLLKDVYNTMTLYLIATPGQEGVYRLPVNTYATGELSGWLDDADMIAAINAQNAAHADLTEADIIALDQDWRAQADAGGELISKLLDHDVSAWLRDQQTGTAGLVTEVFIMDNRGLNVAQSVKTSDYWQGDEAKWQQTFAEDDAEMHIAEIEFDDSTGYYQTQASMPIFDPATNEKIGAITFGINVQSLM